MRGKSRKASRPARGKAAKRFTAKLIRKCVAPARALMVPKGCSTISRCWRVFSGCSSSRRCTASRMCSCSHRVIRRSSAVVQRCNPLKMRSRNQHGPLERGSQFAFRLLLTNDLGSERDDSIGMSMGFPKQGQHSAGVAQQYRSNSATKTIVSSRCHCRSGSDDDKVRERCPSA